MTNQLTPEKHLRTNEDRLNDLRQAAAAMKIDEAYISTLVDTFYDRVRTDDLLAPIFEDAVQGNWEPHLKTMKSFWSSMALGTKTYQGRPMPKHMALKGLTREHFATWLHLFYQTLQDTAPTQEAEDFFIERASRIAQAVQLNIFPYDPAKMEGAKSDKHQSGT